MGAWGIGIYSNDMAEDVKDACKDIFALYDVSQGNDLLFTHFNDVLNQGFVDNEYASFWYALADWQWKHGMLNEFVKEKALSLLDNYAGIEEWDELGNKADIKKRRNVMDNLKKRLVSKQGDLKKPKLKIVKPKHKPGDIIVFRATDYVDKYDSAWHIKRIRRPFMFCDSNIYNSPHENIDGIDAHGRYMAILCVGTTKVAHSVYTPNMFDEDSLYVCYDYLDDKKPTTERLSSCGFLPMIKWELKDYNKRITGSISWVYKFSLDNESFESNCYIDIIGSINNSEQEVNRFNNLLSKKNYPVDYFRGVGEDLISMFFTLFEEKTRMQLVNIPIDNLLNVKILNPKFLSPSEVDQACKKYFKY